MQLVADINWKVQAARDKRASKLCDAVSKWIRLKDIGQFPRSLHGIISDALEHEYKLGAKRVKRAK